MNSVWEPLWRFHFEVTVSRELIIHSFVCAFTSTFFFLFFTLSYFTILCWFCHTSAWIHHGCTCVPNPESPSPAPPHTISLGHPSAPAPRILYPVSNLDWRFISYMIIYMFQCHSPKSCHPLPLPQSSKVCSIHLCLFCCLSYRVIITIWINSNEVDETGTYYTEWSKTERKTPIQYTNTYIWNLERW